MGRRTLHERGVTAPFVEAAAAAFAGLCDGPLLDVGCGEGFYLGTLAARFGREGYGVDISVPSMEAAARRYPGCTWVVANADRMLPFENGAFAAILSITARMNARESRRCLRPDGRLIVAVPGPDDLKELRGSGKDRVQTTAALFAECFLLTGHTRVTTEAELDAATVRATRAAIYRPRGKALPDGARVTFSLDFLSFQPIED
jgi:23S rRNA (guanine745-N1)-methyltransferase